MKIRNTANKLMLIAALVTGTALFQGCTRALDLSRPLNVAKEVHQELGVGAYVKWNIRNGVTTVRVTLNELPAGDTGSTRDRVETIARRGFPEAREVEVYSRL